MTEELNPTQRASVVELCVAAHDNEDFRNLFAYVESGARHLLAYRRDELVSHAMVTTRWLQPTGMQVLRTAYVDAVATKPGLEGLGLGSAVMRRLATNIDTTSSSDAWKRSTRTSTNVSGGSCGAAHWQGVAVTKSC
jgi:hypothetical protein